MDYVFLLLMLTIDQKFNTRIFLIHVGREDSDLAIELHVSPSTQVK